MLSSGCSVALSLCSLRDKIVSKPSPTLRLQISGTVLTICRRLPSPAEAHGRSSTNRSSIYYFLVWSAIIERLIRHSKKLLPYLIWLDLFFFSLFVSLLAVLFSTLYVSLLLVSYHSLIKYRLIVAWWCVGICVCVWMCNVMVGLLKIITSSILSCSNWLLLPTTERTMIMDQIQSIRRSQLEVGFVRHYDWMVCVKTRASICCTSIGVDLEQDIFSLRTTKSFVSTPDGIHLAEPFLPVAYRSAYKRAVVLRLRADV